VHFLFGIEVSSFQHCLGVQPVDQNLLGKKFHPWRAFGFPHLRKDRMRWQALEDHLVEFICRVCSAAPLIRPSVFALIIKSLQ
jgi:hypothetical protein